MFLPVEGGGQLLTAGIPRSEAVGAFGLAAGVGGAATGLRLDLLCRDLALTGLPPVLRSTKVRV